jgi:hypothetical protein
MLRVSQEAIDARFFTGGDTRRFGFGWLWITAFSLSVGVIALWSREGWLLACFIPVAYLTIGISLVRSTQTCRDLLNPLCFILVVSSLRFLLPGILLLSGTELPAEVNLFFQQMKLSDADWQWGHALALLGILAVVMGWLFVQGENGEKCRSELKFYLPPGVKYAAFGGMLVGGIAFAVFFFSNASIDAINSGAFRGTEIREGTGKYFYMTYLLIAGSVLLSCDYFTKQRTWLALFPVGASMLLYWILGGRARALFSPAAVLILLWYYFAQRRSWRKFSIKPLYILAAPFILVSAIWLSFVGSLYRGGLGTLAVVEALSLTRLWDYVQSAIFTDFGQLHSLAAAIAVGPGVLNGQMFLAVFTWPLSEYLPYSGRSPGVFITETLVGFSNDRKWGVNASLIGDAYLTLGLAGTLVVTILFGVLLKTLYLKFREGRVHAAIYAVSVLSSLQLYFLSIEKWAQVLTTLVFMFITIFIGKTVLRPR